MRRASAPGRVGWVRRRTRAARGPMAALRPGAGGGRNGEAGEERGRARDAAAGPQGTSAAPQPRYSGQRVVHKGAGKPEALAAAGHGGERAARGRCGAPRPQPRPRDRPGPTPLPPPLRGVPLPSLRTPPPWGGFPHPGSAPPSLLPVPGKVTVPRSAVLGGRETRREREPSVRCEWATYCPKDPSGPQGVTELLLLASPALTSW